ncbi:MAG: GGDEF domain-containing protein, partial [Sphingomonas sp.]|nr:GGDEF domain-containing protein [Sphingomonas sp.]
MAAPSSASPAVPDRGQHVRSSADDSALLGALPIAAGIFGLRDGGLWIHALNWRFLALFGCEPGPEGFQKAFVRYKDSEGGTFVQSYLANMAEAADELDLSDGDGPSKRFLKFKLAPLDPCPLGEPRCLLSVVDRTVEVQAENNLRAEMLRDSLTGLPNRLSFTETIEARGEDPRQQDHAVLVIDMLRFSRINESMGSLAGDELL